jgi:hypothetical protein
MKKLLALFVTVALLSSCTKETPAVEPIDVNPVAVKIIMDSTSSIFIRVQ